MVIADVILLQTQLVAEERVFSPEQPPILSVSSNTIHMDRSCLAIHGRSTNPIDPSLEA